ncbi:MAG: hypothetical protein JWP58_3360 [Hymenobacter sp.]|nr:hypothetical protein [Hymenobacter sp.]
MECPWSARAKSPMRGRRWLGPSGYAPAGTRMLSRLTAYTEALEAAEDAAVKAPAALALLKKYGKARTVKTEARTRLHTIGKLGPAALAVAEALRDVDTAVRYTHRRAPMQARRYFYYASQPSPAA